MPAGCTHHVVRQVDQLQGWEPVAVAARRRAGQQPQSEAIRAIMLDDSPYVLHEEHTHLRNSESASTAAGPRRFRRSTSSRSLPCFPTAATMSSIAPSSPSSFIPSSKRSSPANPPTNPPATAAAAARASLRHPELKISTPAQTNTWAGILSLSSGCAPVAGEVELPQHGQRCQPRHRCGCSMLVSTQDEMWATQGGRARRRGDHWRAAVIHVERAAVASAPTPTPRHPSAFEPRFSEVSRAIPDSICKSRRRRKVASARWPSVPSFRMAAEAGAPTGPRRPGSVTPSPRAFIFSLENAVCKDAYIRQHRQNHIHICKNLYKQRSPQRK